MVQIKNTLLKILEHEKKCFLIIHVILLQLWNYPNKYVEANT